MKKADEHRYVFLLAGNEKFLKEEWLRDKKEKFFKEEKGSNLDFNQFYVNEIDLPDVLSIAQTKSFLAKKRLIILKDIKDLPSFHRERLLAYAKSPSSNSTLILETDISQKDFLGDKFLSAFSRLAEVIFFKKLYNRDLLNWISRQFAVRKKRIDLKIPELLVQLKGNDLKALSEEIEKLAVYTGERDLITLKDAEDLVGRDITSSVYDIIDAISQDDKRRTLALSLDFQKKDLGAVVGLFCWNLRRFIKAREYLRNGWSAQKIGNTFGINKFQLDKFISQAKRLNTAWLESAISELTEFDLKIKTSGFADPCLGWQLLLVRLLANL